MPRLLHSTSLPIHLFAFRCTAGCQD